MVLREIKLLHTDDTHMRILISIAMLFAMSGNAASQDSVDVTFRYFPTGDPSIVHLPAEFNNWANNSNGDINPGPRWTMEKQADNSWTKTVRLEVGGGSGPGGSYKYMFNEDGSSSGWLSDPLNPRTDDSIENSIIHVRRPTVFHVQPLPGSIVRAATPQLVAEVFPAVARSIDTGASHILVDGVQLSSFGSAYDPAAGYLRFTLPPLQDGEHTITVVAAEPGDYSSSDSTSFIVQAAPLQWLTRSNPHVYTEQVRIDGHLTDTTVTDVIVVRDGGDTTAADRTDDMFSVTARLLEGDNVFRAHGMKDGESISTPDLMLHRIVDHTPRPVMQLGISGGTINLNAAASTDPDGDALNFRWVSEDKLNPEPLNIDQTGPAVTIPIPATAGEYFMRLEAIDDDMNTASVRNYITVPAAEGAPTLSHIDGNPAWVRDAVVYEVFVPAFSRNGDLQGVIDGVPHMKLLGINTLWLMPIMDNHGNINTSNGGYDIIDFYDVDESIGTLVDFDRLVDSCHANGIRVILDITPNHVGGSHPWVEDIRDWGDYSIYRPFIENRVIGDDRGLGQSVVEEFNYPLYARYSNWTRANLNLSNIETREAMMDVYRYWLVDRRADGFRLDVYWGPQNRYGEQTWWRTFREEVKRVKPEAFILGETDGTGSGSVVNYADGGGAMDAGYDWNWYREITSTLSGGDVGNLHDHTANFSPDERYNHYSGVHAHYFRFLENHDEDRIAQIFRGNVDRTKPAVVVMFTAPGIPMIYAGQEVGWQGRRDGIDFTFPPRIDLLPFYRQLVSLRNEYQSLRSPWINRVQNGTTGVYSFLRPFVDENFITAANFRDVPVSVTLNIAQSDLDVSEPLEPARTYYLNDMSVDSTFLITTEQLASFSFELEAFQSRMFLFSDSAHFPIVTGVHSPGDAVAGDYALEQNYPNPAPAGGVTMMDYRLGGTPGTEHTMHFLMYDQLGREVLRSASMQRTTGVHSHTLDLGNLHAGHYMLRMVAREVRTGEITTTVRGIVVR